MTSLPRVQPDLADRDEALHGISGVLVGRGHGDGELGDLAVQLDLLVLPASVVVELDAVALAVRLDVQVGRRVSSSCSPARMEISSMSAGSCQDSVSRSPGAVPQSESAVVDPDQSTAQAEKWSPSVTSPAEYVGAALPLASTSCTVS
jgi:hypothetical protein